MGPRETLALSDSAYWYASLSNGTHLVSTDCTISLTLLALLVEEAGKERGKQIEFIEEILESLDKISHTYSHNKATSPDEGTNEGASKTQGTLPGAHKASPTEEAAVEPATPAGRDKEGAQSPSMASTG